MTRFPITYGITMRAFGGLLGLGPRKAWIDVDSNTVEIRMGWAFHAKFPRTAVKLAGLSDRRSFSLGVHGRNGSWLVNGTMSGLVRLDLDPEQRASVLGRDVRLTIVDVSVALPKKLLSAVEHHA